MPYISLEQQGFYKPFEQLGQGLLFRQQLKRQKEQDALASQQAEQQKLVSQAQIDAAKLAQDVSRRRLNPDFTPKLVKGPDGQIWGATINDEFVKAPESMALPGEPYSPPKMVAQPPVSFPPVSLSGGMTLTPPSAPPQTPSSAPSIPAMRPTVPIEPPQTPAPALEPPAGARRLVNGQVVVPKTFDAQARPSTWEPWDPNKGEKLTPGVLSLPIPGTTNRVLAIQSPSGAVSQAEDKMALQKREAERDLAERTVELPGGQQIVTRNVADANMRSDEMVATQLGIEGILRIEQTPGDWTTNLAGFLKDNYETLAAITTEVAQLRSKLRVPLVGPGAVNEGERQTINKIVADPTNISAWNILTKSGRSRAALKTLKMTLVEGMRVRAKQYKTNFYPPPEWNVPIVPKSQQEIDEAPSGTLFWDPQTQKERRKA